MLWSRGFLTFIFLRWSLELSRSVRIGDGVAFAFVVGNASACYHWLLVYHVVDSFNLFFLSTKKAFWTLVAVINAIVEQLLVLFTVEVSYLERLMKVGYKVFNVCLVSFPILINSLLIKKIIVCYQIVKLNSKRMK